MNDIHYAFDNNGNFKEYGVLCGPNNRTIDHSASAYFDNREDAIEYGREYVNKTPGGWAEVYYPQTNTHICYI